MTDVRPCFDRRRALAGAAGIGIGAPLLAACGGEESGSSSSGASSSAPASPSSSAPGSAGSAGSSGAAEGLTSTSEIAVGGGTIFPDEKVVITQPEEGVFKAFDSTCTHQGCTVTDVENGVIVCPCHFSQFSVADGSVQDGPAEDPLPEVAITVTGDQISLA
ncbi:Rieske (2Fe-2S) protein [Nocardioides insulae]|uniref:Rieske (2Fe-2S) protein n=1 Tax=Nocardioides insulae TaxID=394734 RepID=UPI00048D8497|nr:Rieske (2Fe-2S) protein [Nocardioides insulae]